MRTVNIYALTRVKNISNLQRIERQMSGRNKLLGIKAWEVEGLAKLTEHLLEVFERIDKLNFFYSFQMPKLGKEFDLLRISEDTIINIELKSDAIPDEGIKKQLLQNRYYLSYLGKNMRSYTYISKENRLVRLTNSGKLIEVGFDILADDLRKQTDCIENDIEKMFIEEKYIISPLVEADRFLQKEYFLTSQQKDISKHILSAIRHYDNKDLLIHGFTGLPGTGKTLLLYDIAMSLSIKQRVCIIHCGSISKELATLDNRLKRIDFYQIYSDDEVLCENLFSYIEDYSYLLVDEAHLMSVGFWNKLINRANQYKIPVILSYASEDAIANKERTNTITKQLKDIKGYVEYKLTNRIRTNSELSSFIQCLMQGSRYNHRKDYPSVSVAYANDIDEAQILLSNYIENGYTYIFDRNISVIETPQSIASSEATCIECNSVVMVMDSHFSYDFEQGLIGDVDDTSIVRNLFHGLSRAKNNIALVLLENDLVCDTVLNILQGYSKK